MSASLPYEVRLQIARAGVLAACDLARLARVCQGAPRPARCSSLLPYPFCGPCALWRSGAELADSTPVWSALVQKHGALRFPAPPCLLTCFLLCTSLARGPA